MPAVEAASGGGGCPFASLVPGGAAAAAAPHATQHQPSAQPASGWGTPPAPKAPEQAHVHQAWKLRRPVLNHDPNLTRRQLRRLDRAWTLADVAQHKFCDDGWIAVDGRVYDITSHVANHPGWDSGCRVTEVLSIIAHLGSDCSAEFRDIHASYPVAYKQLAAYDIGPLAEAAAEASEQQPQPQRC